MKLYLIRHGQTDDNANGIVQGWLDTPINQTGYERTLAVADSFSQKVDAIYSSDLLRAVQSAAVFREKLLDTPYFEDGRLRERYLGAGQGKPKSSPDWGRRVVAEELPDMEGAESLDQFSARILDFIDFLKTKEYESVLIVSHGGTIARLRMLLGHDNGENDIVKNSTLIELDI